ncbi:MAG: metal ABC transporter solute-binding protein, Zn/Mn family [Chloroflexota bacterium]
MRRVLARAQNLMSSAILSTACIAATLLALGLALACAVEPDDGQPDHLSVAVTLPPFADFVENIGGQHVEVIVMVPAGASPHTHEPTPGQMSRIADADVYFKVGSGIEFELVWLDNLIAQNRDMQVVDCSSGIELHNNDPHIWT